MALIREWNGMPRKSRPLLFHDREYYFFRVPRRTSSGNATKVRVTVKKACERKDDSHTAKPKWCTSKCSLKARELSLARRRSHIIDYKGRIVQKDLEKKNAIWKNVKNLSP